MKRWWATLLVTIESSFTSGSKLERRSCTLPSSHVISPAFRTTSGPDAEDIGPTPASRWVGSLLGAGPRRKRRGGSQSKASAAAVPTFPLVSGVSVGAAWSNVGRVVSGPPSVPQAVPSLRSLRNPAAPVAGSWPSRSACVSLARSPAVGNDVEASAYPAAGAANSGSAGDGWASEEASTSWLCVRTPRAEGQPGPVWSRFNTRVVTLEILEKQDRANYKSGFGHWW